ncbi:MAG TPA: serine/threonine-protein kinase [Labilithrix sp.]|jgi:serine/threonine protein kinase
MLHGRYVLGRVLGEGAQGSTQEAVDQRDGRLVAVKRFQVRDAKEWKDVELAEREARVLASLSHPRLPGYVEHFEEDGALYLVMDRMAGVSLVDFTKRGAVFGEADVRRFLENAADVLDYLHTRTPPIIHRDLKPRNVIRKPDGTFAFVDFGAVRDKLRPEGGSTIVGTYGYMAPEQFQGRAVPASDVYSIGATALWMLVGLEPEELPHKGLAVDVAGALGPRANPSLLTILSAMLEPDPDKRPRSIGPLLSGFEVRGRVVRAGVQIESEPPPPPLPRAPGDGRDRALAFLRRFLPVFWLAAALQWWFLDRSTALSFTVGVVIVTAIVRIYAPKPPSEKKRKKPRIRIADPRGPGAAVRLRGDEDEALLPDEREEPRRGRTR